MEVLLWVQITDIPLVLLKADGQRHYPQPLYPLNLGHTFSQVHATMCCDCDPPFCVLQHPVHRRLPVIQCPLKCLSGSHHWKILTARQVPSLGINLHLQQLEVYRPRCCFFRITFNTNELYKSMSLAVIFPYMCISLIDCTHPSVLCPAALRL